MDLLQGVKDAENEAASAGADVGGEKEFKMPSVEDLLKALGKMDLDESEKEKLRQSLTGQSGFTEDKIDMLLNSIGKGRAIEENSGTYQFLVLFALIGLVFLILVLFGYKLYKSLAERERRREEKRRQKQFKKKK